MATISVSSASGLTTAMAQAKAGDTILLASGNYGAFSTGNDYSSAVTIKSADAGSPATFSSVSLNGATGITFDSINFDYKFRAGDTLDVTPFSVNGSSNIAFKNSVFDGDVGSGLDAVSNGYGVGRGLAIYGSTGVTVDNSEFKTWLRGIVVDGSSNINLTNNNIHSIRSDGMDFVQVQKVLIEGNNFHDFRGAPGSADHSDFIQFWTSGTTVPSTNITIRNNVLNVGQGTWAESIFIRNEVVDQGQAGTSMYYKNILIENNTISNAHTHGITVGETDGLIIRNNVLEAAQLNTANAVNAAYIKQFGGPTAGILVPQIHLAAVSDNVTVTGNAYSGASWFSGPRFDGYTNQSDWKVAANTYYADKASIPAGSGASNSGGGVVTPPTDGGGVVTPPTDGGGGVTPPTDGGGVVTPPTDGGGGVTPPSSLPGINDYVLNLNTLAKTAFRDNANVVTVGGEKMIRLDGVKDYVDLGRLTAFEEAKKISFEVDFSRDVANGAEARLVWNHMKYGLTVVGDGLMVQVATAKEGFKTINVGNLGLNDTDDHTIRVVMNQVSNRLQIVVDGEIVLDTRSTDLKFVGAGGYEHGWTLGSPWDRFFDGDISDFRVEARSLFVKEPTTTTVTAAAPATAQKTSSAALSETATESKVAVASPVQKPIVETAADDAANTKLASLFWANTHETFAVSDKGALVRAAADKAEPALSNFADLFQTKTAPSAAKVVVDTAADRLQVVLKQAAAQQQGDDDLDAQMADVSGSVVTHCLDSLPDAQMADLAAVADAGLWEHVFDGHALFA